MELRTLSVKRGIYSFYNGSKYIIYSEFYGVVAESKKIERYTENPDGTLEQKENIEINFDICSWYGYWDLKSIISRGIRKLENRFVNKKVTINFKEVTGTDNSLNKILQVKTIKR